MLPLMAALAILPSCADTHEEEGIGPCPVFFGINLKLELHGVVSFDSIIGSPSIIIDAADAKEFFPEMSDSVFGLTLYPYQGSFFEGESNSVTLQYGDHVKLKIGKIYSTLGGSNNYPCLTVDLLYAHKY